MAYVSKEMKSEIAPVVKKICQKYGVKGTLSVQHHSILILTIQSGSLDFFKNYNETISGQPKYENREKVKNNMDINHYWYHEHFTGKVKEFFDEIFPALKGAKYFDDSDSMTDYFSCSHYFNCKIGKWDKPYQLTA